MFKRIFTYAAVLKRHREGPLARERANYLERLASEGMAHETLLWRARYSLCVARGLESWPFEHRFVESDIDKLALPGPPRVLCKEWQLPEALRSWDTRQIAKAATLSPLP